MAKQNTGDALVTMVRTVEDNFQALLMCRAMENCGGVPFSVVMERPVGLPRTHDNPGLWHVFGRVPQDAYDRVDDAFVVLLGK
jgi:hypothetical protein